MTDTWSPTAAWAASARCRPSAIELPCSAASDPAVTPTSSPPPRPPARTCAGMTSSETPRLGPSVVGVSATADWTPRVARTSARVAGGNPGPLLETARSCDMPAFLCVLTTWSNVVVLNSRVQLIATVRISGVLADEKRRVAAARFADARKPPTGEIAANTGLSRSPAMRARIGPRQPTAMTRKIAVISDVAAAVDGELVVDADGEQRDRSRDRHQSADTAPEPDAARLDGRGGQRAGRGHARGATSGGEDRQQRHRHGPGDDPCGRERAGADGEVGGRDSVAHESVGERSAELDPRPDSHCRSDEGDGRRLPRDHAANLAGRRGDRAE